MYELTYNYGQDKYDNFHGEGYAQVAMSSEVSIPANLVAYQLVSIVYPKSEGTLQH